MSAALVRFPEIQERYGIPYCFDYLIRLEKEGKFPKRVKLGRRTTVWRAEDIEAWLGACRNNAAETA